MDLPAPDAPTNATFRLGGMTRVRPSRTGCESSYLKVTSSSLMGWSKSGEAACGIRLSLPVRISSWPKLPE